MRPALLARFASSSEAIQKNADESYASFRSAYLAQQKKFQAKMDSGDRKQKMSAAKGSKTRAYAHPFHHPDSPIVQSGLEMSRDILSAVGPELVSPHYENFSMSRKWALFFWTGIFGISYVANRPDIHHMAASAIIPFVFWTSAFYFFLEGRKSTIKPFLYRFHCNIVQHEINLMMTHWNDNMREYLNEKLDQAREQIEYYSVHEDYHAIKAESVNRFLAIEQVNLRNHIQQRANKLLQTAEQMEVSNQRYLINSIVTEALGEVDRTLKDEINNIQDAMFESALIGIRQQKMTYENDPLLPLIRNRIQGKISKLTKMTEEEKDSLISLTNDQVESLRVLDRQMRDEYLKKVPKLETSVRAYPQVKKALENWGRDVQEKK